MKHVFDNLSKVGIQRLIKGVEDSVLALWPIAGNDFRRFDIPNGATVLVGLRLEGCTEVITVQINHPDHKDAEQYLERITFPSTMIGRRNLFREHAEEMSLELSLQIKQYQLTKEK
jgi:hypothetical protein